MLLGVPFCGPFKGGLPSARPPTSHVPPGIRPPSPAMLADAVKIMPGRAQGRSVPSVPGSCPHMRSQRDTSTGGWAFCLVLRRMGVSELARHPCSNHEPSRQGAHRDSCGLPEYLPPVELFVYPSCGVSSVLLRQIIPNSSAVPTLVTPSCPVVRHALRRSNWHISLPGNPALPLPLVRAGPGMTSA